MASVTELLDISERFGLQRSPECADMLEEILAKAMLVTRPKAEEMLPIVRTTLARYNIPYGSRGVRELSDSLTATVLRLVKEERRRPKKESSAHDYPKVLELVKLALLGDQTALDTEMEFGQERNYSEFGARMYDLFREDLSSVSGRLTIGDIIGMSNASRENPPMCLAVSIYGMLRRPTGE